MSECVAKLTERGWRRTGTRAELLLATNPFGLQVSRLRLLDVPRRRLVRKESFFSQLLRGALDAGDVPVAREIVGALQQTEAPPCLRRRLAIIPRAVAGHVD